MIRPSQKNVDALPLRTARQALRWIHTNNAVPEILDQATHTLFVYDVARMHGHIARWFWVVCIKTDNSPVLAGFAGTNKSCYYRAGRAYGENSALNPRSECRTT